MIVIIVDMYSSVKICIILFFLKWLGKIRMLFLDMGEQIGGRGIFAVVSRTKFALPTVNVNNFDFGKIILYSWKGSGE